MTSHELAKILLENEDLPISTYANNHAYYSSNSNGRFQIALIDYDSKRYIQIGNIWYDQIGTNNRIIDKIHGGRNS